MFRSFWSSLGLAVIILLGSYNLMGTVSAQAQDQSVTMRVTPYLRGHVKYGEWLPLRVSLENDGMDLEAEVQAEVAGSNGTVVYAAPANLPAGARKEIIVYILPSTFAQAVDVHLVHQDQTDRTLAEVENVALSPHPQNVYLVGVVSSNPDGLTVLNSLSLKRRSQTRMLPLALTDLPERFEALRSLDVLIIAGVDTTSLSPAQAEALRMWVESGGRLLLGGGTAAHRVMSGFSQELQPVQPTDMVELADLDVLADYAGEPIKVSGPFLATLASPSSLAGTHSVIDRIDRYEQPLLVQRALGEGWVGYLALDPTLSPFDAWAGTLPFWQKLLSPGAAFPNDIPTDIPVRTFEAEQMNYALSNLPALDLPSTRWLALLLGLYILLVGPVNYFVLRRSRRLGWAWITIPVLTLTFSVGSYGLGHQLRGSDVIVNQISVLSLSLDSQQVPVRSYVGLFSPTRQSYNLLVGKNALVSSLTNASGLRPGPMSSVSPNTPGRMSVLQGDPVRVRGMSVNQWSMQSFQAETVLETADFKLDVSLALEESTVRGALKSNLSVPLEQIILISGNRFVHLGNLAPGESRQIEAVLGVSGNGAPFPWAMFEQFFQGPKGPSREMILRRSILEAYFHTNWGAPSVPAGPLLLAWADVSPVPVQVDGGRAAHKQTALIVVSFPLQITDGQVKLVPGMLSAQVVETEGEAGECGPGRAYIARGHVTLEYTLPTRLWGMEASELLLQFGSVDRVLGDPPLVQLYDWEQETWVELQGVESEPLYTVQNPQPFLSADAGIIRLRALREGQNRQGGCYQFDIGLEGRISN